MFLIYIIIIINKNIRQLYNTFTTTCDLDHHIQYILTLILV